MISEGIIKDADLRAQYWMDTPFSAPGGKTREEATCNPGNAVKSKEREDGRVGFPKYYGRLAKFTDGEAVVISHEGGDKAFVWRGSSSEYLSLWDVD